MGSAQADFSAQRGDEGHYWHDYPSYRTITGSHIAADQFSLRALCFAVPMAAAIWLAVALLLYRFF